MAGIPLNANDDQPKANAGDNRPPLEHVITLAQIHIFVLVCVAGAAGTLVSWTLSLNEDIARYNLAQVLVAGAAAATIMVFYLARTDTRNVIYACCFALLCGMVGPTVLRKAVKDFKDGIEAGKQVQQDAEKAQQTANSAPPTVEGIQKVENQATQVIASTQKAVEKDAPQADVQSGKDAVATLIDKLKQTATAPETPPETAAKAAEAVQRIGQTAQQANLPKVAQKADEARRSGPAIAALGAQLASADDKARNAASKGLTDIGQDAVAPLLNEVIRRTSQSDEDSRVRSAAANALAKMKQPIVLSADQAATVVRLLDVSDAGTRLSTADFLMNLEDSATIHHVFRQLSKIARAPDQVNANAVYNTAIILGTWARSLNKSIPAPNDLPKPADNMRQASLQEAKGFLELVRRHTSKWKHTISDLEALIKTAEAKQ